MPPKDHPAAGYILLEVMVALIVAALVLRPLTGVLTSGLARQAHEMRQADAASIAESLLAEEGITTVVRAGEDGGIRADGTRWDRITAPYRDQDMSPTAAAALEPYRVIVRITWDESGVARRYQTETLRLGTIPAPAP